MNITISRGTGTGPTPLAAFDAALRVAGVGDYNLIVLSSVIPAGSRVITSRHEPSADEFGRRLFVVLSRAETARPGEAAWAGLGWAQGEDGRGLFVEQHGESQQGVSENIRATLAAMIAARGAPFGPIQEVIVGGVCCGPPMCAVVVAIYRSENW